MTSSSSNQDPSAGANPTAVDNLMMELRSLTATLTDYLVHRKSLEERRTTFRTCLAVFIISMGASAAITSSWIAHSVIGTGAIRSAAPKANSGVIVVRNSAYERFKAPLATW